jgi:trimeric autotransporter adhesin
VKAKSVMKNRNTIFTVLLALAFLVLSSIAQAVSPAPDGGYPGFNTAEGQNALFSLTTGGRNTALGAFSLYSDTIGAGNTAVGINALRRNITGGFNTAVGLNALFFNDSTGHSIASYNSAVGSYALFNNTDGWGNTAFGSNALFLNATSDRNTAIGDHALYLNSASANTAVGDEALTANASGTCNTATGTQALADNSSGNFNTAFGCQALFANNTGGANTAVGINALRINTSGGANTALGYGAGANVTTGSYNVYLGFDVPGVANEVGHTYISNISSTVQPPGGNVEYVTINLDNRLLGHSSSSQRYKQDIKPMTNASEALYQLKPVTYRYRNEVDPKQSTAFGLIAEEVAEVNPALVARNSKGQPESVHYEMVNAMLLNEFLKEHRKVQQQEATIAQLQLAARDQQKNFESNLAKQQKQIEALASSLQGVKAELEVTKRPVRVLANNP